MPQRRLLFFLVVSWIAVVPCRADIVPVSVSQQVSLSGGVFICDPTTFCLDGVGDPFSSSDSGSVSGVASVTFGGATLSGSASASQASNVTPNSIDLSLQVNSDFHGPANHATAGAIGDSQYSLVFDLTSPSLLQLTGNVSEVSYSTGFYSSLTHYEEVHLTGPGFQFDQNYDSFPFSKQFVLAPGEYTFTAFANSDYALGHIILDASSFVDLSLSADFTNIPEPSHIAFVLGLCIAGGVWLARRYAH